MLNRLQGVFASFQKHKVKYLVGEQKFYVASKADLIASKLAAGREIDLEDVRLLQLRQEDEE